MRYLSSQQVHEVIRNPERFLLLAERSEPTKEEKKLLVLARAILEIREYQERFLAGLRHLDSSIVSFLDSARREGVELEYHLVEKLENLSRNLRKDYS